MRFDNRTTESYGKVARIEFCRQMVMGTFECKSICLKNERTEMDRSKSCQMASRPGEPGVDSPTDRTREDFATPRVDGLLRQFVEHDRESGMGEPCPPMGASSKTLQDIPAEDKYRKTADPMTSNLFPPAHDRNIPPPPF